MTEQKLKELIKHRRDHRLPDPELYITSKEDLDTLIASMDELYYSGKLVFPGNPTINGLGVNIRIILATNLNKGEVIVL